MVLPMSSAPITTLMIASFRASVTQISRYLFNGFEIGFGFGYTALDMSDKLEFPPASSSPLFPELPKYGSPNLIRRMGWLLQTLIAFPLYMGLLLVAGIAMVLDAFKSKPERPRPYAEEEARRAAARESDAIAWRKKLALRGSGMSDVENDAGANDGFVPTEGGPDRCIRDLGHYARRVGLDSETFKVQTEDGHILTMWHVFDPKEYSPMTENERGIRGPECIDSIKPPSRKLPSTPKLKPKYPILMIHGLLQSSGVYAANDENSLAFWLCKQGYDVWLGNNRSGFTPEHISLKTSDPSMWSWNIRHMGTLDLPALTARILSETAFEKLALIGHSQGTTQTLLGLSTSQRPSLGSKLSIFCALAPAAYAGTLLNAPHFKFLRDMPGWMFRTILGYTAFLPVISFVSLMQGRIPQSWMGTPSYWVYQWIFEWTDTNWDRGVRDRCFMWAPCYISVEGMFWWLARGGFANQGSILDMRDVIDWEDDEDLLQDYNEGKIGGMTEIDARAIRARHESKKGGQWYDERSPPLAFWVAGRDELVDGRKLLNRFERGREPSARVVFKSVMEDYEHLDVCWAVDVIERVGWDLRDWIWRTCDVGDEVRMPRGCEGLEKWIEDRAVRGGEGDMEEKKGNGMETEMKRGSWEADISDGVRI